MITSRVHPGESNASLMMKGYLDYLLSNHQDAKGTQERISFAVLVLELNEKKDTYMIRT